MVRKVTELQHCSNKHTLQTYCTVVHAMNAPTCPGLTPRSCLAACAPHPPRRACRTPLRMPLMRRSRGSGDVSRHVCPAMLRKSWRLPAVKRTQRGADAAPGAGSQRARGVRAPRLVLRAQQHPAAGLHAVGLKLCAVVLASALPWCSGAGCVAAGRLGRSGAG
jgi:hypothetical protein